jgi:hypothetical protein
MGDLVSNNKREATYHGPRRAFLVGDWVYVTDLPRFDHRLGKVVAIRDSHLPYVVQIELPEEDSTVNRAFDWLALTPAENQLPALETTGEHIFHKLGDDLYQDWADDEPLPKVDHWTPTPGELGLALGIIGLIIVIFVFVVLFYRGW